MAHEIDTVSRPDLNGSMAYAGDNPWHGLGQQLNPNSPIEEWATQAGMDWQAEAKPVLFYDDYTDEVGSVDNRVVLVRSDTRAPLSVVSTNYNVVQPMDVLEFFRDILATGGFTMESAGVLFGGRRFWASAKIHEEATIMGHDKLHGYVLLCTAMDASLATTAAFTNVRVVCNNTLTMAYNDFNGDGDAVDGQEDNPTKRFIKISHASEFNADLVKAQMGLAPEAWQRHVEQINLLAKRPVTQAEAEQWVVDILGDPEKPVVEQLDNKAIKKVLSLFNGEGKGSDLVSADGTAWGLVNALTEYADHHRQTKTVDSRFDSAQFGEWSLIKSRGFNKALQLV